MKKLQAKRAIIIIKKELKKLGKKNEWDMMPIVELQKSEFDKNHYGVQIRTDGDSYDQFYDNYNNQEKVAKVVNKKLKTKLDDHYFEKYGQGILDFY